MELDKFFEDFEAQFDAEIEAAQGGRPLRKCNLVRVFLPLGSYVDLVAAILGSDFIAGMALGGNDWRLVQLSVIDRLVFRKLNNVELPALRLVEHSANTFLEQFPLPLAISWLGQRTPSRKKGVLIGLQGECLLVEMVGAFDLIGVPLASIDILTIDSVENFGSSD
jgi:hypothetical protein